MNKTAAIYARVSSQGQKRQATIRGQIATVLEYAREKGYVVPEEWRFEDDGYTGSNLARPGLEQLRDLASEGEIGAVIVLDPDRLARNYALQTYLLEEFERSDTKIEFIKSPDLSTPSGKLIVQFQGMIAEYEREQITDRCRRGKKHKARSGAVSVLPHAPYGYRYVKKIEGIAAAYHIKENEASIVRELFNLYSSEGHTLSRLSDLLFERKIESPRGRPRWDRSTIRGILANSTYKGQAGYGKTEKAKQRR